MKNYMKCMSAVLLLLPLAACETSYGGPPPSYFTGESDPAFLTQSADVFTEPSALRRWYWDTFKDQPIEKARSHFYRGDYGLAEKFYRIAIEEDPQDKNAWLGLAASYDQLGRYDNAEKAYDVLVKLEGYTAAVLNNLGYHYYKRGEIIRAKETWQAALKQEPGNRQIRNNLKMLRESGKEDKAEAS